MKHHGCDLTKVKNPEKWVAGRFKYHLKYILLKTICAYKYKLTS